MSKIRVGAGDLAVGHGLTFGDAKLERGCTFHVSVGERKSAERSTCRNERSAPENTGTRKVVGVQGVPDPLQSRRSYVDVDVRVRTVRCS